MRFEQRRLPLPTFLVLCACASATLGRAEEKLAAAKPIVITDVRVDVVGHGPRPLVLQLPICKDLTQKTKYEVRNPQRSVGLGRFTPLTGGLSRKV